MGSNTARIIGIALLGIGLLVLAYCSVSSSSASLRYRLIVEVETPQGPAVGSSVLEITGNRIPDWLPNGGGTRGTFRGEAVAIDLPNGQTLFALLRSESGFTEPDDYPGMAFQSRLERFYAKREAAGQETDFVDAINEMRSWTGARAPLPKTDRVLGNGGRDVPAWPLMVAFRDIADPTTVFEVTPGALPGGGRVTAVTVEITDQTVTTGIEKPLAWLPNYYDQMLDGNSNQTIRATNKLANSLTQGDFSKGVLP